MEFDRELNLPPVERWEHDPNPLVGELINRYEFQGDYEPAEMLTVLPDGGEVAYSVLCGKTVLRSFIERRDPQIGGKVGVKFVGTRQSQSGQEYADYNTAYQAPEGEQIAVGAADATAGTQDGQAEGGETEDLPF